MVQFPHFGLNVDQPDFDNSSSYLGGKGAGLVWMSKNGVPVPPGFIIPTEVWSAYDKNPEQTLQSIAMELSKYLGLLEAHFGYRHLLSVRSGSRVSCPGMMDTILNVGIEFENSDFWQEKLGKKCYEDSFHRLITMYGSVVKGIDRESLERGTKKEALDTYHSATGNSFPGAFDQLMGAIEAVFKSWDNERAFVYRKLHNIPREWGTAVTVQAMVFGNLNNESGTGVLFTRNADTGENKITGEFLVNAQGEDVVAGIRTPVPLEKMFDWNFGVASELVNTVQGLEKQKKDVQDVEFTIQDGKLYILQTRNAKRTAMAAVRVAVEMAKEGLISKEEAIQRVTPKQLDLSQTPTIDPKFKGEPTATGIAACSGVAKGKPVFNSKDAVKSKVPCILITKETTPDDISGMLAAKGVITMEGGLTSHAAVVARGENKPCITGLGADVNLFEGVSVVTMDGATGRIWLQDVPILEPKGGGFIAEFEKMVAEVTGVTPALMEVPSYNMPQAILHLGSKILSPQEAVDMIVQSATYVDRLYVDLTHGSHQAETMFFQLFESYGPAQQIVDLLEKHHSHLKDVLVMVGEVKTKKFKMLGVASDLRSIILADKELSVDGAAWDSDDPAIQWVLKHKKQEGLSFVSLGSLVPGVKSMVSVHQALKMSQTAHQ
jgi:pyruvate,phosphate dikinase